MQRRNNVNSFALLHCLGGFISTAHNNNEKDGRKNDMRIESFSFLVFIFSIFCFKQRISSIPSCPQLLQQRHDFFHIKFFYVRNHIWEHQALFCAASLEFFNIGKLEFVFINNYFPYLPLLVKKRCIYLNIDKNIYWTDNLYIQGVLSNIY